MFRPCSNKTLKALTCLFNTQNNSLIGLVNGGGRVGLRPASTTSTTTFWFSNMYPIRRKWSVLDPRWHLAKRSIIGLEDQSSEAYQETVNRLIPMGDVRLATQFRSLSVSLQPNLKEGGLFARLEWELDESAENRPNSEKLIDIVRWHLTHKSVASAFNFLPVEVHHVKGEPFIEDMRDHLTSTKLKVEFEGPDVHLEKIYRDFRNYGRIFNIIPLPPSSKDLPRYSMVHFTSLRSATNARNCLNGEFIDGTRLFIKYEKTVDGNSFIKSLTDHPRITIPIILALLATTTFLIFDPLRCWFVENKFSSRFEVSNLKKIVTDWWMGLSEQVKFLSVLSTREKHSPDDSESWKERQVEEARLLAIHKETPESLILISGPRGSGKSELVENSLKDVKFNLVIDCEDLINIPETTMLARFASSVGFYPEMSFFNSFGGIFDGIVASMTGTKAGFATSADTQLRKILEITGLAATRLLLEEKQKKAAWQIKYGGSFGSEGGGGGEGGKTPPEPVINYPVIVIEGFMNREKAKNDFIYDLIAEWAATLVENHIAHVVFVSSNPASIKSLSKATPNRGIETLVLEDASAESALEFVRLRLGSLFSSMDLKLCIEGLGGRRTDLEHLVQKVRAGTKPLDAFADIVSKSMSEILKLGELNEDEKKPKFTVPQFWKVISLLSRHDEINFDDLKFDPLFNGDASSINQLEHAGLLTILHHNGRPTRILSARPVFRVACQHLVADAKLAATMGIVTVKELIRLEEAKLQKWEIELERITASMTGGGATRELLSWTSQTQLEIRIKSLVGWIGESSKKLADLDVDLRALKDKVKLIK